MYALAYFSHHIPVAVILPLLEIQKECCRNYADIDVDDKKI